MRGAAAVELALVMMFLLLLAVGAAEFGRAFYQYNTIVKATRSAARMLSAYSPTDTDYPLQSAKCLVVYGNTGCTGSPLSPNLSADMVQVSTHKNVTLIGNNGVANMVVVKVSGYTYQSFFGNTPLNLQGMGINYQFGSIQFGDIHTTMRQVL